MGGRPWRPWNANSIGPQKNTRKIPFMLTNGIFVHKITSTIETGGDSDLDQPSQ
jgi:hypothetical protein